ncbi:MAG: RagB/SusD family nutrient uptake outer membrane protein [Tannerella sp.]|jgi:hypothetical protein|nr:RagB/SusD family nutrient uptake outer membrane protein [Tannerella sp.]
MKLNNYILMLVCTCLLFAGCSKDLDLIPKDTISDKSFWKSAADYKLAANNLYLSLEGFAFFDLNSDMAFNTPNSTSNGTLQPSETDANWTNAYTYIRRCNNIVLKAADSPIQDDVKVYVAEAKFFRAYNYWRIFRLYGGVPLITGVLDIDSEELYSPRASRKETIDLIIKDLTEAAADLPESKSLAAADKGRITKGAANALKARAALFEGTWGKYRNDADATAYLDIAIEASNAVINSGQYTLYKGMAEDSYRYLFIEPGDDSDECILDRRYQKDISHHSFSGNIQEGNGYLPAKKLADMYLCNDGLPISKSPLFQGYNTPTSEYENRDPRMTMTFMTPGVMAYYPLYADRVECWPFYPSRNPSTGYTVFKFMSEDVEGISYLRKLNFDYHIIRYAEVLLIYAEAVFEKNGSIGNADLDKTVNVIRERVNMPVLTNDFVSANGLDMKQELRRERTVELAMEGVRWDDLRRWKTAETEMKEDIKGIKIKGSEWTAPIFIEGIDRNPYAQEVYQNRTDANGFIIVETGRTFDPNKHYLLPLPTKEVAINPKLEQNPGW